MDSDFWIDKRVLITGCNGFLGSWLTKALVGLGADVVGIIRDKISASELVRSDTISRMTVVEGSVSEYALMERVLAEYEIEFVFHLAAQTIVSIANRAPLSTFETNIKGTWTTLEAVRRNPTVRGTLIASSDKAYGTQEQLPYTEESPLLGRHPYDVSKSCADMIAQAYACTYDLPIVVTRFANLFGGGDLNWNRIVPGTIRSVIRGERPIIRSDGLFKRDYLYVEDAVSGYLLLAQNINNPDIAGKSFNFGVDQPITVLEMVEAIIGASGATGVEPAILNEVANEIPEQYLDSTRAHQILGWYPTYTLSEGLDRTFAWYRDFLVEQLPSH